LLSRHYVLKLAVLLILTALVLFAVSLWLRRSTGVPWVPLRYVDTGGWQRPERPLISRRYNLVGKPDYVVQTRAGFIPIEVKPARTAAVPYDSDLAQLAAYCLLIEDTTGHAPPYGLLRYANQSFRVPYTPQRRAELLQLIAAIQLDEHAADVPRSHQQAARCRGCGFFEQCDDRLEMS
jgi:CRISPR-associated exonuclease Cas4